MQDQFENRLIHGDCTEVMRAVPDKSVNLIFTSPPHISETAMHDLAQFKRFQREFCFQFTRVIADDGFIVICQANHRYRAQVVSNYVFYANQMFAEGMLLKDEKIVYRRPPVGRRDLYRFTYQMMSVWTRKGTFKRSGVFLADTIIDEQPKDKGFTQWTPAFCDLVINALSKPADFVLDPFAATGAVLESARRLGRSYCGIEINEEYHSLGVRRLQGIAEVTK